jgi:hypothetical protein
MRHKHPSIDTDIGQHIHKRIFTRILTKLSLRISRRKYNGGSPKIGPAGYPCIDQSTYYRAPEGVPDQDVVDISPETATDVKSAVINDQTDSTRSTIAIHRWDLAFAAIMGISALEKIERARNLDLRAPTRKFYSLPEYTEISNRFQDDTEITDPILDSKETGNPYIQHSNTSRHNSFQSNHSSACSSEPDDIMSEIRILVQDHTQRFHKTFHKALSKQKSTQTALSRYYFVDMKQLQQSLEVAEDFISSSHVSQAVHRGKFKPWQSFLSTEFWSFGLAKNHRRN